LICRQNREEDEPKDTTVWVREPLTAKARKGHPQPAEKRTEKRWETLGQPVQDASKEGQWKDKEIYWEVV
jgi:hypothetical protein